MSKKSFNEFLSDEWKYEKDHHPGRFAAYEFYRLELFNFYSYNQWLDNRLYSYLGEQFV